MVERTASPLLRVFDSPPVTRLPRQSHANGSLVTRQAGTWLSALALFAYAAAFSFAYNSLSAGTGALLLFGAVQATMILWGLHQGERCTPDNSSVSPWPQAGWFCLSSPGSSGTAVRRLDPDAGRRRGLGHLFAPRKRREKSSQRHRRQFPPGRPLRCLLSITLFPWARIDRAGLVYAILSGAIASGLGYVIWYTRFAGLEGRQRRHRPAQRAVLAATGGILLLGEPLTVRFLLASGRGPGRHRPGRDRKARPGLIRQAAGRSISSFQFPLGTVNPTSVKRMLWLDVAKGLAILIVVYFHFFPDLLRARVAPPPDWSTSPPAS